MGALSSSGVYGDATKATREKGEVTLGEIIEYMVDVLDRSDSVKDVYKGGK